MTVPGSDVLELPVRFLSRLPAPWVMRLRFSHQGQPVEIEASSAGVSRRGWAVSEAIYVMAASLLGRIDPRTVARMAADRVREYRPDQEVKGRGDGRHDTAVPLAHLGTPVDVGEIERGRRLTVFRGRAETRESLSWSEVSSQLAGVVPEMVSGTVGEALAAMRCELVEAGGDVEERPIKRARQMRAPKPGPDVLQRRPR